MGNDVQKTAEPADYTAAYSAAGEASRLRRERRKKNKRFNTVLYCVAGALVLSGVFIILRSETNLFSKNSADVPSVTVPPEYNDTIVIPVPTQAASTARPAVTDPASATPTYPPPTEAPKANAPVSIYFNDHNVSCSVQPVGVDDKGTMETVPSYNIVGWYKYGAAPNQPGNCIIAGHNRYSGQLGSFSLLHKGLSVGDKITVELADGSYCFYSVASINTYRYDEVPDSVMASGGEKRLTLITCLGDYNYDLQMSVSRVVAVCVPLN